MLHGDSFMFVECVKSDRLYEHTIKFEKVNKRKVPRICGWANLYQGKKYGTGNILSSMKDKEVCDVVFFFVFLYITAMEV